MEESASDKPPAPPSGNVSLDEALAYAVDLHKNGFVEGAEQLYGRILELAPKHPDALNFRGMALAQLGRKAEAVDFLQQAAELSPGSPDILNNLGNGLYNTDRFGEAAKAYSEAARLRPEFVEAWQNLGQAYDRLDRHDEALSAFQRALELQPYHPDLYRKLGMSYYAVGRIADAAKLYTRWLEQSPDDPHPKHMLAACTGKDVPTRAHDAVVQRVFDAFANSFDTVLKNLDYQAPLLIADKIKAKFDPPAPTLDVLDLGCGTGLCGALLRPYAKRLVGIDLSPNMLERARDRGCYDELTLVELTAHMQAQPNQFDLITAGDVFCYLGDLVVPLTAARSALRAGGLVMFTVEAAPDDASTPYVLLPHGRYSQRQDYLGEALKRAGLEVLATDPVTLRIELKKPVAGFLVVARRPAAA